MKKRNLNYILNILPITNVNDWHYNTIDPSTFDIITMGKNNKEPLFKSREEYKIFENYVRHVRYSFNNNGFFPETEGIVIMALFE